MAGYDIVKNIDEYCKYKRKPRMVILHQRLLPVKCNYCGKPITNQNDNRTWIFPKERKAIPLHYECAWKATFKKMYGTR